MTFSSSHAQLRKEEASLSLSQASHPLCLSHAHPTFRRAKAADGTQYGNTLYLTYDDFDCLSPYQFSSFLTPDDSANEEAYALTDELTTCVVASLFSPADWFTNETDRVEELSFYDGRTILYVSAAPTTNPSDCGYIRLPCTSIKTAVDSTMLDSSRNNLIILQPGVTHSNDLSTVKFQTGDITIIPLSLKQETVFIQQNTKLTGSTTDMFDLGAAALTVKSFTISISCAISSYHFHLKDIRTGTSLLTLENMIIAANSSPEQFSQYYLMRASLPARNTNTILKDTTITNVCSSYSLIFLANLTAHNTHFKKFRTSYQQGGCITISNYLSLHSCTFEDCVSTSEGGALYLSSDYGISYTMTSVAFIDCHSSSHGGAIFLSGSTPLTLSSCIFKNNTADSGSGHDVVLNSSSVSNPFVSNCFSLTGKSSRVIVNNSGSISVEDSWLPFLDRIYIREDPSSSDDNSCINQSAPCLTLTHAIRMVSALPPNEFTITQLGDATQAEDTQIEVGEGYNITIEGNKTERDT